MRCVHSRLNISRFDERTIQYFHFNVPISISQLTP